MTTTTSIEFSQHIYGHSRSSIKKYISSLQDPDISPIIITSATIKTWLNEAIEVGSVYHLLSADKKHCFMSIIKYLMNQGLDLSTQPLETLVLIPNKHIIRWLMRKGLTPLDANGTLKYVTYEPFKNTALCKALVRWYINNGVSYARLEQSNHKELTKMADQYYRYVAGTPFGETWLKWRTASFDACPEIYRAQVLERLDYLEQLADDLKRIGDSHQ